MNNKIKVCEQCGITYKATKCNVCKVPKAFDEGKKAAARAAGLNFVDCLTCNEWREALPQCFNICNVAPALNVKTDVLDGLAAWGKQYKGIDLKPIINEYKGARK